MSVITYSIGFLLLIAGVIYGAILLNIPYQGIAGATIVTLGLCVLASFRATGQHDPAG